jgi:PAS domain S-box-containing protein
VIRRKPIRPAQDWLIAAASALIYALVASAWIYVSDKVIELYTANPQQLSRLQTYKGWVFVVITALLLYVLINKVVVTAVLSPPALKSSNPPQAQRELPLPSPWHGIGTPIVIFLLLASAIGGVGYLAYDLQRSSLQQDKQADLLAIADNKANEIARWLNERRKNAELIAHDPLLSLEIKRWLSNEAAPDERRDLLLNWLNTLKNTFDYSAVMIVDDKAQVRLGVGDSGLHPRRQALVLQAMQSGQLIITDLHWRREVVGGIIEIDVAAPLSPSPSGNKQAIGALFLKIDPEKYLFPLIQSWPTPSPSAETLLIRREGKEVVFLNELRHLKGTALRLRFPIGDEHLPAAKAAAGLSGVMEGLDYRRVPVLAASRMVPGTSWYVVAKIDADEVYAPIQTLASFVVIIVGILIAWAGIGTGLWWRQQHSRFLAAHYRSELERQALVQHFDYLAKYANDIILLADAEGRLIEANARAVAAYGHTRGELLGMNIRDLCHPETQAYMADYTEQVNRSDGLVFEALHRRKDGSSFPVEVSARVMEIEGRRFVHSLIRDISERKQAEGALRESEAKFRKLFEEAIDGIALADPDSGILLDCNRALLELLGREKSELIGKPQKILHPLEEHGGKFSGTFERHRAEEGQVLEAQIVTKSGEIKEVEIKASSFELAGHSVLQGIFRDVTERKSTERALKESEARLRAIATAVPDVLLVMDEDGRYVEILTAEPQLVCAYPESLKGKLLTEVLSAHLAERFLGMIRQTLLTRQIQMAEYELQIAKVGRRYFEARMAPIEALVAGRRAVAVVARDITERRLTEEKLRHAQKMEAIGQLTGGIAHDFNNLLAIILANLELLDEQLDDRADLRDLIHRAFAAVDRGANLTQRLLAFSRRQPLQPKLTDLNALVAGMSDMLHRTLGETIEMQTVLAEGLLATRIDPGQFETALLNLVLNARDAMPRGGKLMITTANRWLDEDYARTQLYYVRTGQYVMLAVSDTGTGMAPEVLEHAFEPFFTTKAVGKGSGLGLSMVYGLVKQSGGYINIYSEIGKGTMVRIYLPWAQSEGLVLEDEEKAETVAPRGRAETILVVEDDPHVRQLAVSMLKNLGYHTVEADNARTALEVLDEQPLIVLLFTDLVLPGGVDGVELAKEARRRRPGLKVLFTTGYMESDRIESDLEHGAELLTKPYRKHSLASKLSAMLSES